MYRSKMSQGSMSLIRCFTWLPVLAVLMLSQSAFAQHEGHAGDVFVGLESDHIVTGLIDEEDVEMEIHVFASEMGEAGVPGYSDEPGWEAYPGTFNPDSRVGWNAMAGLGRWNGDGFDTGIDETLTISFGTLAFEIGADPVAGFDLAVQPDGGLHRHVGFYLDNATQAPAVGVYLVELELYSTDSAVEASEPIWIVFNNEASEEDHEAAIEWVEENLALEEHCDADLDGDHDIDVEDLLLVIEDWGCMGNCIGDVNGDGATEIEDLLDVIADFGGECH